MCPYPIKDLHSECGFKCRPYRDTFAVVVIVIVQRVKPDKAYYAPELEIILTPEGKKVGGKWESAQFAYFLSKLWKLIFFYINYRPSLFYVFIDCHLFYLFLIAGH